MPTEKLVQLGTLSKEKCKDYYIEVVSIEEIERGVCVHARSWDKNDKAIGFGKDGDVEIERFNIINPPTFVPDGTFTEKVSENGHTYQVPNFKEDPKAALLASLEHTISVKKEKRGPEKIKKNKVGSTTSTFHPDASPGPNTFDARPALTGANASFTSVRDGNGTSTADTQAESDCLIRASGTSDQYERLIRLEFLFNTGPTIDAGDTITSAVLSLVATAEGNDLGGEASANSAFHVCQAVTASETAGTNSDYENMGDTSFGATGAQNTITVDSSTYTNVTLGAGGIAAVAKGSGVSKYGWRYGWDISDTTTGLTWSSTDSQWVTWVMADTGGTTITPKLVVEHSVASSVKTFNGLAQASISTFDGLASSSTKTVIGVANT